jgi:hypothetical protein
MSRQQIAGLTKTANKSFKNVAKFKYPQMTLRLTNQDLPSRRK